MTPEERDDDVARTTGTDEPMTGRHWGEATIWKYPLVAQDWIVIEMPVDAEPLCIQSQHGAPYLWAAVDPTAPREERVFRVYGTGAPNIAGEYIGTFQLSDGGLVFHVFDVSSLPMRDYRDSRAASSST